MDIEKVKVMKTLKAGSKVYLKGEEYTSPEIDEILLAEARMGIGTVKILSRKKIPSLKVITRKPRKEDETASTSAGTTSNLFDEEKVAPPKAKSKLVKRKGK